jgi:hypothetical protein
MCVPDRGVVEAEAVGNFQVRYIPLAAVADPHRDVFTF